jgi:hypothetical protein
MYEALCWAAIHERAQRGITPGSSQAASLKDPCDPDRYSWYSVILVFRAYPPTSLNHASSRSYHYQRGTKWVYIVGIAGTAPLCSLQ